MKAVSSTSMSLMMAPGREDKKSNFGIAAVIDAQTNLIIDFEINKIKRKMRNKKLEKELAYERGAY